MVVGDRQKYEEPKLVEIFSCNKSSRSSELTYHLQNRNFYYFNVHSLDQEAHLACKGQTGVLEGKHSKKGVSGARKTSFWVFYNAKIHDLLGAWPPEPQQGSALGPFWGAKSTPDPQILMPRMQNSVKFWARSAPVGFIADQVNHPIVFFE